MQKNVRRCERWLEDPPPPIAMSMPTDSMGFFKGFPKYSYWQKDQQHMTPVLHRQRTAVQRVRNSLSVDQPKAGCLGY